MLAATTSPWYLPVCVSGQMPAMSPMVQPLAGAQLRVNRDALGVGLDADRLEADVIHVRAPAGSDEQAVAAQLATVVELDDVSLTPAPGRGRPSGDDDLEAVPAQDLAERLAQGRRLTREQVLGALEQHGLAAEPMHRLRQLDPDRPAADHEQPARDRRDGGRLAVGPDAIELLQPRDRRD
jgi:hypothetical protein